MQALTKLVVVLLTVTIFIFIPFASEAEVLSTNSPQFAARSETEIFKIKYRNSEELAEILASPGVRIKPIISKNLLIVQALPKKIKDIEKQLALLDSPLNPYQVRYNLYVIELKSELASVIGLEEIHKSGEGDFHFLTQGELITLAGEGVLSFVQAKLLESSKSFRKIAEPSVVAGIDTTSVMNLSREVIYYEEDITTNTDGLNLKITPESINDDSEEICTEIVFSSTDLINTELSTSVRTKYYKPVLIGVFSQKIEKANNSSIKKQNNYFALYLSAQPVGSLPAEGNNVFNLGGLAEVLQQTEKVKPERGEFEILYNDQLDLSFDYQIPEKRMGINLKIENQDNIDQNYMEFGFDYYLVEELKIGTRFQVEDDENKLKLGVNERLKMAEGLHFSAGYYPLVYNISKKEIVNEKSWWIRSELKYSRFFLDLKYSGYEDNNMSGSWKGLLGCKVSDPLYIMGGIEKNGDNEQKYIGGISLKVW